MATRNNNDIELPFGSVISCIIIQDATCRGDAPDVLACDVSIIPQIMQ